MVAASAEVHTPTIGLVDQCSLYITLVITYVNLPVH